jgi:hypothetical protein
MFVRANQSRYKARQIALRFVVRAARAAQATLIVSGLVLGLIWSPVAFAVQLKLNRGLQFHQLSEERREEVGVLKAGSVIDVPDEYRINDESGKFSSELTLNNWLKTAGRTGMHEANRAGGVLMKASDHLDYYYPVKIVSPAAGSTLKTYKGNAYFLALRMITRQKDKLVTRADTKPQVKSASGDASDGASRGKSTDAAGESGDSSGDTPSPKISKSTSRTQTEGAALCLDGTCNQRSQSSAFDRLIRDLEPALRKTNTLEARAKHRTSEDMRLLADEFQRSCGFSLSSFIPVIKERSERAGIPADVMMSIMVQESSGHCFASARTGSSNDSGLFGVNSRTANVRRCQAADINWLRHAQAQDLSKGPQCKENPYVNLNLAISILTSKLSSLTSHMSYRGTRYSGFDESHLLGKDGNYTRDALRLAVSAYNGGERWVMKAKADLEEFNTRYGTRLSPYNWEDLRIFYLRSSLEDNREAHYFRNSQDGRIDENAIANLSYSENIVPRRNAGRNETPSINEYWRRYFATRD